MPQDSIHLERLKIATWVGVPTEERAAPQSLEVSLDLFPRLGLSGLGDHLTNTVDYWKVAERVREIALASKRRLIETLADDIATALLENEALSAVSVEVRKFIVPHCDHVAVRLHRQRQG